MSLAVTLVGVLLGLFAMAGIFFPFRVVGLIRSWRSPARYWTAVALRVGLGVLFITAAPECRMPRTVYALGVVMIVIAVGILVMGRARVDALIDWWLDHSSSMLAVSFAALALFGTFLVYAGW